MKILLVYRINTTDKSHSGALIKMDSQKKAFMSLGHEVDLINHDIQSIYLNKLSIQAIQLRNTWDRFILNHHNFFKALLKQVELSAYDLIYIRYPFSNPAFLKFCKRVKQNNPKLKLVIEMPTFPYNDEFEGLMSLYLPIDNFYRKRLHLFVDRIVHFGKEQSLFGIPAINVTNGINVHSFNLKKKRSKVEKKINLIAVGKWSFWHGLDRLIKGMDDYFQSEKIEWDVYLKIIGEGNAVGDLKALTASLPSLKEKINFAGIQIGESLNASFDKADIGIGTLGIHRKQLNYNASLKHREYCIRGLKFILSTEDKAFPNTLQFVKYMPANDSNIDILKIVALHEHQLESKTIREFGETHLSWRRILSDILKELDS